MNHQYQSRISKFLAGVIFVFACSGIAFPYLTNNHTPRAFTSGTDMVVLEEYVVEGAGYFLESYSYMLSCMQKVELSSPTQFNHVELQQILDKTIQTLKKANETYVVLKQKADQTAYNPVVIDYLLTFDYDGFLKTNDLRFQALNRVKNILVVGDVRAIYGEMVTDTSQIIAALNLFKADVDAGVFPDIPTIWRINQAYTDTLLFGQYVAQIFDKTLTEIYGKY